MNDEYKFNDLEYFEFKDDWYNSTTTLYEDNKILYIDAKSDEDSFVVQYYFGYFKKWIENDKNNNKNKKCTIKLFSQLKCNNEKKMNEKKNKFITNNYHPKNKVDTELKINCEHICSLNFENIYTFIKYWTSILYSDKIYGRDGIIRTNPKKAYENWIATNDNGKLIIKYMYSGILDEGDKLNNGFFDPGRCNFRKDYSVDLNDYINNNKLDSKKREIILLDKEEDSRLQMHVKFISSMNKHVESKFKLAKLISLYIANVMTHKTNRKESKKHIQKVVKTNKTNVIKLGDVRYGTCRHKSLLYKYLCDEIGLKCSLIRGNIYRPEERKKEGTGKHIWNIVKIKNRSYIVDVRNYPGKLVALKKADEHRLYSRFVKYQDYKKIDNLST